MDILLLRRTLVKKSSWMRNVQTWTSYFYKGLSSGNGPRPGTSRHGRPPSTKDNRPKFSLDQERQDMDVLLIRITLVDEKRPDMDVLLLRGTLVQ